MNNTLKSHSLRLFSFPETTKWGATSAKIVSSGKTVTFTVAGTSTAFTKQLSLQECNRSVSLEVTVPKGVTFDWLSVVLQSSYAFVTTLTLVGESVPFEWIEHVLTYDNFPSLKTLNVRGNVDALLKALNQKCEDAAEKKPETVTQPVKSVAPSPVVKKVQPAVSEKSVLPASNSAEKEEKVVSSVTSSEKKVTTPTPPEKEIATVAPTEVEGMTLEYAINGKTYSLRVTQASNTQLTIAVENKKGERRRFQEMGTNDALLLVPFLDAVYAVYVDKKGSIRTVRDNLALVRLLSSWLRVGAGASRCSCGWVACERHGERFLSEADHALVLLAERDVERVCASAACVER